MLAISAIVLVFGLRAALLAVTGPTVHLQPYQWLDAGLSPDQRTLYQALLASVEEIIGLWRAEGRWPDVARLRSEGLPPFEAGLLPAKLRKCAWQSFDLKDWMDYLGECQVDGQPEAFLLRIVDLRSEVHPHPHPTYDPALKEAAQVWIFKGAETPYPISSLLEADWMWIVNPQDPSLKDRR